MLLQYSQADRLGCMQDSAMRHGTAKWGCQGNHRGDVLWPLIGQRTCDHSTEAMTDQMNFSSGLLQCRLDGFAEVPLNQQIRTLRINADSRKIRTIPDARQPTVQFCQIKIGAQKSWNDNHRRTVATRHAEAVVNRGGMEKEDFGPEQRLRPHRAFRF